MKKYLNLEKNLAVLPTKLLEKVSHFVIGPFGSAYDTKNYLQHSNYRYVRGQDVKPIILGDYSNRYISEKDYNRLKKYSLEENDLLVSVVGTLGNVALVQKQDLPAVFSNKSTVLRLFKGDPVFLMVYMNTDYGKMDLLRNTRGTVQTGLNLEDLKKVKIPWFSNRLQMKVRKTVIEALQLLNSSKLMHTNAENLLLEQLNFEKVNVSKEQMNIQSLQNSFLKTGRLDAEYYQPKYEQLLNLLKSEHHDMLSNLVEITKSIEPGSSFYQEAGIPFVRVQDVSVLGIEQPNIYLSPEKFTDSEVLYPKKDTILISKDGTCGIAYKVDGDYSFITSSALLHLNKKKNIELDLDYLTLVLNSPVVQMQAERDAGGSIINHWKISQIEQVVIPLLKIDSQKKIGQFIRESFKLRRESERLLEIAKEMVELAIEKGEQRALDYLNHQL